MTGCVGQGNSLDSLVAQVDIDGWVDGHGASMYDVSACVRSEPPCGEYGMQVTASPAVEVRREIVVTRGPGMSETVPPTWPCLPLSCLSACLEPDSREGAAGLRLSHEGGYGPVNVEWDIDGDAITDAVGNSATVDLAVGQHQVTARATDGCVITGVQACSLTAVVDVPSSPLPFPPALPEVCDVLSGAPPLELHRDGRLVFELVPQATAFNLYLDRIGSWYAPSASTGTTCAMRVWTDNGDGTGTSRPSIPVNTWIDTTASDGCSEGPLGVNSFGVGRTGLFSRCGPAP